MDINSVVQKMHLLIDVTLPILKASFVIKIIIDVCKLLVFSPEILRIEGL